MDATRKELTPEVVEQLGLEYKVKFDHRQALRLIWATFCFTFSVYCLHMNTLGWVIVGAGFGALLILNALGMPLVAVLDAESEKRLERWSKQQDEE